ncbi:MAG: HAD-IIIA family hydrolase [Crocinitomicaceae bacterium]|nr:HAD-IIIA family hydrolase [Crocinitomicaceae bacterium]
MISYKERLNKITTFIFDVDGVLTNGDVIIFRDEMVRIINSRDSFALRIAAKMGYKVFVITGGTSEIVKERLLDLGVHEVFLRSSNKTHVYEKLLEKYHLKDEEILYMGDDIPDYKVMERVGCATCPQDASVEIKSISHYQSPFFGGRYAARDVIEQTMRLHGKWFTEEAHEW